MTVDLLSVRLKEAKRELTALKTAHLRGLGMLNVYKNFYTFESLGIQDDHFRESTITINISNDFPPFALIMVLPQLIGSSAVDRSLQIESVNFTNNGYTMVVTSWVTRIDSYGLTGFSIVSTAPIANVSIEDI